MSGQRISPNRFREAEGVGDWRIAEWCAMAFFATESYAQGLEVAGAVGSVTDRAEIDIRKRGVTVRLPAVEQYEGESEGGYDQSHIDLARRISVALRGLGRTADPSQVQQSQVAIDTTDIARIRPFWRAVLGYREVGEEDLLDPHDRGMAVWFQEVAEMSQHRNRIHVDVFVPYDQVRRRVDAALAAGGRIAQDKFAPMWWTLADADGNEVDVTSIEDRD
jgi:4a-hydroxytetrahydrobiopterin dehydratase